MKLLKVFRKIRSRMLHSLHPIMQPAVPVIARGNKSKMVKVHSILNPEQEQIMIECLEDHPILYNKELSSYKDIAKKNRLWKKAAEVGKPVLVLKTWCTSLKSR